MSYWQEVTFDSRFKEKFRKTINGKQNASSLGPSNVKTKRVLHNWSPEFITMHQRTVHLCFYSFIQKQVLLKVTLSQYNVNLCLGSLVY